MAFVIYNARCGRVWTSQSLLLHEVFVVESFVGVSILPEACEAWMFGICRVDHGYNRRLNYEKLLTFGSFLESFEKLDCWDLPPTTFDFIDGLPSPFQVNTVIQEELVVEELSLSCHGLSSVCYFDSWHRLLTTSCHRLAHPYTWTEEAESIHSKRLCSSLALKELKSFPIEHYYDFQKSIPAAIKLEAAIHGISIVFESRLEVFW